MIDWYLDVAQVNRWALDSPWSMVNAISSSIARFNKGVIESILDYVEFYTFVLENVNQLTVLSFNEITQNTMDTLNKIRKSTGIDLGSCDDLDVLKKQIPSFLTEVHVRRNLSRPRKENFVNKWILPSEEREKRKQYVKQRIRDCRHFKKANDIFNALLNMTQA